VEGGRLGDEYAVHPHRGVHHLARATGAREIGHVGANNPHHSGGGAGHGGVPWNDSGTTGNNATHARRGTGLWAALCVPRSRLYRRRVSATVLYVFDRIAKSRNLAGVTRAMAIAVGGWYVLWRRTLLDAGTFAWIGYPVASRSYSTHGFLRGLVFSPFPKRLATDHIPRHLLRAVFTIMLISLLPCVMQRDACLLTM